MSSPTQDSLSRRERQIMDVIYRLGRATAADVFASLADPPSDATVRKLIRILEEKGHITHRKHSREHVYFPVVPKSRARLAALRHLLDTFYDGSAPDALAALLKVSREKLTREDAQRLSVLIERARREGR